MCNKNTKFRTDMWSNTKMKIINTLKERDMIFYVWFRITNLATVVDDNGYLYITKNMPYTVNTLSIEFDRSAEDIALALNILLKLEMIEYIEERIFKVKNWQLYQKGTKAVEKEDNKLAVKDDTVMTKESNLTIEQAKTLDDIDALNNILSDINPKVKIKKIKEAEIINDNDESDTKVITPEEDMSERIAENEFVSNKSEVMVDTNKSIIMNNKQKRKSSQKNEKIKNDFEVAKEEVAAGMTMTENYVMPKDQKLIASFNFKETP